ncbi:hypothetical protein [Winogradskyella alexanderae]|uniref:Uncharacterized protein n=1 Tax=Winogradskyella alexanderae TaxID=2877123 RepID=A0ABS7XQ49_9FLAO|nr:hypothetical protein [Winogradskyella alexanderae]MCA0132133.1 hypothetical protein [Winogradskyella alexanderae]
MKKHILLLLLPLFLAMQCEDDITTGFETTYIIDNTTNSDLLLLNDSGSFIDIPSQSLTTIGSTLNSEANAVAPSEAFVFNTIKLYRNENDNFIYVYEQDPLEDDLWELDEPTVNRFEYKLIITEDLIN